MMSLPKNNWFAVRVQLNKIHNRIFFVLGKNPVYQFIEARPVIQAFRRDNYRCYYFAVYMVLFILVVMVVTVIRNCIMAIMRRVLGIKQRYDI